MNAVPERSFGPQRVALFRVGLGLVVSLRHYLSSSNGIFLSSSATNDVPQKALSSLAGGGNRDFDLELSDDIALLGDSA